MLSMTKQEGVLFWMKSYSKSATLMSDIQFLTITWNRKWASLGHEAPWVF